MTEHEPQASPVDDEPAYKVGDLVRVYEQPEVRACPFCQRDFDEPQSIYLVTPAKGDA